MFYSSKYKPSAALLKDIDEYISGPLGFSNMVTCFKLLPHLYEKIATEYLELLSKPPLSLMSFWDQRVLFRGDWPRRSMYNLPSG